MTWLWDVSTITGALPVALTVLGALGLVALLLRRDPRWWVRLLPITLGVALALTAVADVALELWRPFPESLPARILLWAGLGIWAVVLVAVRVGPARWWGRIGLTVAMVLVVALSAMKINAFYGYRPNLGAVFGVPQISEVDFAALAPVRPTVSAAPHQPLSLSWHPPADQPKRGEVTQVAIDGTRSGFKARPAMVYLPPAYLGSVRPLLPVLVLIPGQPGGPEDWFVAGKLASVMDGFAAAHAGLAPIVVVPDATGSPLANTLCLDSQLGNAESYLAEDVPAWLTQHLQVDPDRSRWAIGGFSFGGTCALQLALRRPAGYPTFLDVSGRPEPTLGDHASTVQATFGGDEARFRAVNPLDILAAGQFPGTAGYVVVGRDDPDVPVACRPLPAAAERAGISLKMEQLHGGHTWALAITGLQHALPWIASRAGLIP
ncbi:alpha/beta hydrolase [Pseudonocardia sp. CA-107938]|uniref:alpha/beta hydrolase n=1 Tax=Pseudonocardia sp. CA-107938 TaxID=3240021 RepID=UPI003D904CDD